MFSNSEHRRLCHFLNIEAVKPNTTARINASPATTCVPEEVMSRLGRHFGQLIKDVDTRCPELRVREFWKTTEKWSQSPFRNDAIIENGKILRYSRYSPAKKVDIVAQLPRYAAPPWPGLLLPGPVSGPLFPGSSDDACRSDAAG